MKANRSHLIWVIVESAGAGMAILGAISMLAGWAWGTVLWFKKSLFLGLLSITLPYLGQLAYGIIYKYVFILLLLLGGAFICIIGWYIGEFGEQRK